MCRMSLLRAPSSMSTVIILFVQFYFSDTHMLFTAVALCALSKCEDKVKAAKIGQWALENGTTLSLSSVLVMYINPLSWLL